MAQDLRTFVTKFAEAHPGDVIYVKDAVSRRYELQAVTEELDRRRRAPILVFANVTDSVMPVIANVMASRRVFAGALGVNEEVFHKTYARRLKDYRDPLTVDEPLWAAEILTDEAADLGRLPIPTYYPGDAGPYITAGMTVARDPETGVETLGYHRYQVKGPRKMGVSLHSRRRMFEYHRRAEQLGQSLPAALCLGMHPVFGLGALSYPPSEVSKFKVIGGLLQEPMEKARCVTIDLEVPASAEIVIEGEILSGVREAEGPFGEFTGYLSQRSTENVFSVKAICMGENPWYQSISSGLAPDHIWILVCYVRSRSGMHYLV